MSTVYCPQRPARWDGDAKLWIPTVNINPATKWGELKIMFDQSVSRGTEVPTEAMRKIMADFTKDDFVCAIGDPALLAIACCLAVQKTGGLLRLLRWDRQAHEYFLIEERP